MTKFEIKNVIDYDYCIGCGTCSAIAPKSFQTFFDEKTGQIKAEYLNTDNEADWIVADNICPFSSASQNEDQLAEKYYSNLPNYDKKIGYYYSIYVSKVVDKDLYAKSSSGGLIRWILMSLLEKKIVSKVLCVTQGSSERLFQYSLLESVDDVINSATSSYYPIEWSQILNMVDQSAEPIAITGVPCFIKSLKNYVRVKGLDPNNFITIGLICGHLKTAFYSYMLAEQLDVSPSDLSSINFRKKIPNKRANDKGVSVTSKKDCKSTELVSSVKQMFGTDYGFGLFKYKACDFCDDVLAETSDVVVGDAWLPEYMNQGHSLVITRNMLIDEMIREYSIKGDLITNSASLESAIASQDAGLRHRKDTISYRMYLESKLGNWIPKKRYKPHNKFPLKIKLIQRLRILAREKSLKYYSEHLNNPNFERFKSKMNYFYGIYKAMYSTWPYKIIKLPLSIMNLYNLFKRKNNS